MRDIAHLDIDEEFECQRTAVRDLEVEDITAIVADDGGERGQRPGRILGADQDPRDGQIGLCGIRIPSHVEPVGHAGLRALQFLAVDRVNDDAFARHHQPHDAVAGQRMAALAEVIGDALRQAPDGDRLVRAVAAMRRRFGSTLRLISG